MSPVSRDRLWQGRSARAQRLSSAEETYTNITQKCWEFFVDLMRNVTVSELCEWKVISRYGVVGWLERTLWWGYCLWLLCAHGHTSGAFPETAESV